MKYDRIFLLVIGLMFVVCLVLTAEAGSPKRVPFIYCSDLYQPPVDPDDHYDLAILASLEELELKAVIFDNATPGRKPEDLGEIPLSQISKIAGKPIPPWKRGLHASLQSPT